MEVLLIILIGILGIIASAQAVRIFELSAVLKNDNTSALQEKISSIKK